MNRIAKFLIAAALPLTVAAGTAARSRDSHAAMVIFSNDGITKHDVKEYLKNLGYKVQHLEQIPGTCNWTAQTTLNGKNLITTVFTDCSIIIGHEDIDG